VMENVGFEPETIHGSVHTRAYNHVRGNARTATTQVTTPWERFHVYAIEWSPAAIDFFVDGRRFFRFENEGTGNAAWPFDQPQYLIINLAIGGSWGGQQGVDDTLFPHRYLIDYVRVYQRGRP
jgi:beta-glucanase (GH16 family)